MAVIIQLRRGAEQAWIDSNPTLAIGEMGVETDTGKFKVGDGVTEWNSLAYSSGDDGADGADGSVWYSDSREPSAGDGKDHDVWLNTDTNDLWWKNDGSWSIVANVRGDDGADGADGSVWHSGAGEPSAELGKTGDYYLNTETGDVYWNDGTWSVVANITGPAVGNFDGGHADSVYTNQSIDGGVQE